MHIQNKTRSTTLAQSASLARNFFERTHGLLGKKELFPGEALVIPQCPAIHMFFMRFPIDVVFVDKAYKVVGLVKSIKPFQLSRIFLKAYFAIELKAGTIDATGTKIGDLLNLE